MVVPTIMTSVWLTIYGGLGIQMEMRAEAEGIGGNQHILRYISDYDPADYDYRYNAPKCSSGNLYHSEDTYDATTEATLKGTLYRLSCRPVADQLFDVIDYYYMNDFISAITIIAIVTYFVTSSDSGSHVIDMMCCNGEEDPPMVQRIFWALSEGAVASVLLAAGDADPNAST
eukprot:UN26115